MLLIGLHNDLWLQEGLHKAVKIKNRAYWLFTLYDICMTTSATKEPFLELQCVGAFRPLNLNDRDI